MLQTHVEDGIFSSNFLEYFFAACNNIGCTDCSKLGLNGINWHVSSTKHRVCNRWMLIITCPWCVTIGIHITDSFIYESLGRRQLSSRPKFNEAALDAARRQLWNRTLTVATIQVRRLVGGHWSRCRNYSYTSEHIPMDGTNEVKASPACLIFHERDKLHF